MPSPRLALPWLRRREKAPFPAPAATPAAPVPPERDAPPFPRPVPLLRHEWLDVTVARATLLGPLPVPRAKVVVRAWPRGEEHPRETVARAFADAEGAISFHLPVGRYALTALHGEEARTVAVTVEHAGRATVILEDAPRLRLRTLRVEVADAAGAPLPHAEVEAHPLDRAGEPARTSTDAAGVAFLALAPGAYEVRAAGRAARVHLQGDLRLRLAAPGPEEEMDALLRAS